MLSSFLIIWMDMYFMNGYITEILVVIGLLRTMYRNSTKHKR